MKSLRPISRFAWLALAATSPAAPLAAAPPALDPSFGGFGSGGSVVTASFQTIDWVLGDAGTPLAVMGDGRILVAGRRGRDIAVLRLLPDGGADASFGTGGIARLTSDLFPVDAQAVAVDAGGRVVVAGAIKAGVPSFLVGRLTASGFPDPSFGNQGLVTTDFDDDEAQASGIVVQPDGKIVAAGRARVGGDFDFAIARYLDDGAADVSFGDLGRQSIGFGGREECESLSLLGDGKLLLVGVSDGGFFPDADFGLARLSSNGTLDATFDGDGKLSTGFGDYETATACFVQPDGRWVAVGYGGAAFAIARYLPDGQLDDTLDGDGKAHAAIAMTAYGVAVQLDGKIVVTGNHELPAGGDRWLAVCRLLPDGSPDPTFADLGKLFIDYPEPATADGVAVLPDGRLLVSGQYGERHVILRLLPDGSPDENGRQTLAFEDAILGPAADEKAYALVVDDEGRAVLAGEVTNHEGTESHFGLARFTASGAVDRSFGDGGRVRFGFVRRQGARAVALQPDGKIVAAGQALGEHGNDFMVARFRPDGSPDPAFHLFSLNVADFAGGDDAATCVAIAPDGKILVGGNAWDGSRTAFAAARFKANGALDPSFDSDGKVTASLGPEAKDARAIAVQPDGTVLLAGTWKGDAAIMRWNADGSVSRGALIVADLGDLDGINALALADDGSIVAAGHSAPPLERGASFLAARFTPRGVLDTTFGSGGKVRLGLVGGSGALAIALRGDGSIALAGEAGGLFAVAQLTREGHLDGGLAGTGTATTGFGGSSHVATGVAFAGEDRIVAGGYQVAAGDANFAVARFVTSPALCEGPACTGGRQIPSDANQDARLDISDAVWLLGHLFSGTNPVLPCDGGAASSPGPGALALLDANGDGGIDISDAVRVLGFLFAGSQPPALGKDCTAIPGCPDRC